MTFAAKTALSALVLTLASLSAQAGHASHPSHPSHPSRSFFQMDNTVSTPRVDARQARQQARIHQGVASGAITPHEHHRLQQQQRGIRHAERHAKADGVVTAQERQRLDRLQDHASRSIQRQQHDRQAWPHPAAYRY